MKRLRIYQDLRFREHNTGDGHPENSARLQAISEILEQSALLKDADFSDGILGNPALFQLAHEADYLNIIEQWCSTSSKMTSAEINLSPASWNAMRVAAGTMIDAVDSLLSDELDCAFIAPRPPGHHAETKQALGFCLINNIAIAALHARKSGIERVTILDWDLHHGNGTQEIFWNDPSVQFISLHQAGLYPVHTGFRDERGGPNAIGMNINFPLAAGTGDEILMPLFSQEIEPAIISHAPQLLLISAGFDAHSDDPLGNLQFSFDGFDWMTTRVNHLAARLQIPILSVLEGGYNPQVLAKCVTRHCEYLLSGVQR